MSLVVELEKGMWVLWGQRCLCVFELVWEVRHQPFKGRICFNFLHINFLRICPGRAQFFNQ